MSFASALSPYSSTSQTLPSIEATATSQTSSAAPQPVDIDDFCDQLCDFANHPFSVKIRDKFQKYIKDLNQLESGRELLQP